jgi:hypothetical protein
MARVRRSATRRWEPGCSATGTVSGEGPATLDQVFRRSGYCVAATRSAFASRSRRTHSVIGRSFAWSMSRTTCRSRGSTYDGRDGLGRRAGHRSGAAASRQNAGAASRSLNEVPTDDAPPGWAVQVEEASAGGLPTACAGRSRQGRRVERNGPRGASSRSEPAPMGSHDRAACVHYFRLARRLHDLRGQP